ncbi:hypothetical protein MMC17_002736 [Xylographa soralifera]|nr:hypothetical protein [Xylographa soralifera]
MPMANGLSAEDGGHRKSEGAKAIMAGVSVPNGIEDSSPPMQTRVLPVDISKIGQVSFTSSSKSSLEDFIVTLDDASPDAAHLQEAAQHLLETDIPVAFPTETVYGLGADATRSTAVRGIYAAKRRPLDNPLIVHICSLSQLRSLLQPQPPALPSSPTTDQSSTLNDPIPAIYTPLIQRFWPGPLTILLPHSSHSVLAPEVTAGLPTFGARMPSSLLALALIKTAGVPLAAPSANASTRPSPTTAQHVKHDLDGRIGIILDGGPCAVGVESTVVDGLSDPPSILRPGGISLEQLRECPGWENTVVAYKDGSEAGKVPRAPGMKYKHYSPKARVILIEAGIGESLQPSLVQSYVDQGARSIGILRTKLWTPFLESAAQNLDVPSTNGHDKDFPEPVSTAMHSMHPFDASRSPSFTDRIKVWDIALGESNPDIARGLFSGLRELDQHGVDVIFVEGIDDAEGDAAAAVMNRLRKAAEVEVSG